MLVNSVVIALGFVGLIWGADKFVFGASALARNAGVSPLLIGLTIVAFGTSAPEIFSSAVSALEDKPELAIGNAFGSNLFNIGVALGVAAILRPLTPPKSLIKKELPALILVTLVTGALLFDLFIGLFDALVLIALSLFLSYKLLRKKKVSEGVGDSALNESEPETRIWQAVAYMVLGLILLIVSAEALVASASAIAEGLGVSEAIIGLTIVALGTSLPELAASITCVLKGHYDLAIGNIVGSNIINLLAVLPFPGLLSPGLIQAPLLFRDFAAVTLLTLLLAAFCYYAVTRGKKLGRLSGVIFLSIYCGWFTVMLVNA
ncbi:MAG: calcium/sodium antiporter [Proteobacteria bacterium]|nr:calcium/sodium antiporter [Pseudomonadota bacterium]